MNGEDDEPEDQPESLPSEQPTVDAGSARAVKKRLTKLQILQREEDRFWQGVFESEVGRRCLWKLLSEGHPFDTIFACGPNGFPQESATWFRAGEQALSLRIYQSWLAKYPLEVMAMHKEQDHRFAKKKDE
jgi:hypothetical protein